MRDISLLFRFSDAFSMSKQDGRLDINDFLRKSYSVQ